MEDETLLFVLHPFRKKWALYVYEMAYLPNNQIKKVIRFVVRS